jgi:hypothetical protein|tara:strand:- start:4711 stop:4881 length:171 start_codon:yes stop_codon:yes gene_type:complete
MKLFGIVIVADTTFVTRPQVEPGQRSAIPGSHAINGPKVARSGTLAASLSSIRARF